MPGMPGMPGMPVITPAPGPNDDNAKVSPDASSVRSNFPETWIWTDLTTGCVLAGSVVRLVRRVWGLWGMCRVLQPVSCGAYFYGNIVDCINEQS